MQIMVTATIFSELVFLLSIIFEVVQSGENDGGARTRVIGGHLARKNEIPYIVALFRGAGSTDGYNRTDQYCGGSIYNKKFIITATHCLKREPIPNFSVVAGTVDISQPFPASAQVIKVKKYTKHPGYGMARAEPGSGINGGHYMNDIAVLELEKDLVFNDGVQPIAIPPTGTVSSGKATLAGWGHTNFDKSDATSDTSSEKLMTVDIMVVPRDACDKYFREIALKDIFVRRPNETGVGFAVPHESMMCASEPNQGGLSCGGDSGSPLQCSRKVGDKIEKYQCGIVAYGLTCANKVPTVYTDVAHFHDWIVENTKA